MHAMTRRSPWALLLLVAALALLMGQADAPLVEEGPPPEAVEVATQPAPAPAPPTTGQVPLPSGANVAIIRIEDLIYDFTLDSLERRVDRALDGGATLIVIELDTLGGDVVAAINISKYLKSLSVPTIAWVNDKAYSAGTMISAACDQIVMADGATIGDSAPIALGQDMSPTERAKALSPILEEYRDDAQRHGYDFALFHAMCELGIEVYQVEHKQTGEVRHVNQSDFAVMVQGAEPDAVSVTFTPGSAIVTAAESPPALDIATAADKGQWTMLKKVHDGRSLLTLSQSRAEEVGLSRQIIRSETQLQQYTGAQSMAQVNQTWSEDLAAFLTHPVVRIVLIAALLIGGYTELQAPGVGLPGAIALGALVLLLGAPMVIGLAEVWHIILFVLGLFLLIVELLFTPTFGLLGVAGIVMMLISLVISVVPMGGQFFTTGGGTSPVVWGRLVNSALTMLLGLIASGIGLYFVTRYFGSIPLLNRLILEDAQPALAGQVHTPVDGDTAIGGGAIGVGDTGKTLTTLHPAGEAIIKGSPVDVVALGGWVDRGEAVRVVEVHGNRIVVDVA